MQPYDLNDAEKNTFEVIPAGTHVPVIFKLIVGDMEDELHAAQNGSGGRIVKFEAIVTDGPYAKRKLFLNLLLDTRDANNKGHQQAKDISKAMLRAIVEAARGFSPTDESAAAIAARKVTVAEIDGMQCTVVVGIEPASGKYSEKNIIKRVVPVGKGAPDAPGDAASAPKGPTPTGAAKAKPAQSAW